MLHCYLTSKYCIARSDILEKKNKPKKTLFTDMFTVTNFATSLTKCTPYIHRKTDMFDVMCPSKLLFLCCCKLVVYKYNF